MEIFPDLPADERPIVQDDRSSKEEENGGERYSAARFRDAVPENRPVARGVVKRRELRRGQRADQRSADEAAEMTPVIDSGAETVKEIQRDDRTDSAQR